MENKEQKEFREERFEFALYVNDNLIAKRNFKINNYIDGSMHSIDFKEHADAIVRMIDGDLKSKSRVYTWFYAGSDYEEEALGGEMAKPWEYTFKFVITDNKNIVYSRIWDGYGYPKAIRERVDIANKTVKITTKDGRVFTYDKNEYFKENEGRLSDEMYILKAMMNDKPDLLLGITKRICEVCSPREDGYQTSADYTFTERYKVREYLKNEDGTFKRDKNGELISKKIGEDKKYHFDLNRHMNDIYADWGKSVAEKTKEYFKNLY